MTTAYERAIKGGVREMWREGKIVAEVREPSDRLLIWLLERNSITAGVYALGGKPVGMMDWSTAGAAVFDATLATLADSRVPAEPLTPLHYQAGPPSEGREALAPPYDEDDDDFDYEDA
ncbi:hypothetical protein [Sphingomonas sp. MS122]|uniref:hypothetical protein n=1 Tax=Sphingomonas sp. MS122 TaxID=3412683 RepID=UPI003C2ACD62